MRSVGTAVVLAAVISALACKGNAPEAPFSAAQPWDSVVARARGTTVQWRMWRGDPSINSYVDNWVAPRLKKGYGITLRTVDGQGPDIVNQLVVERDSRAKGSADLIWINGETFSNLRRARLLFGPWASQLPNAAYVDSLSPVIMRDSEQPTDGLESPWGRVQFALIYDTLRVPTPPRTVAELATWIRAHPGRFTHDQEFTGMTFLKAVMYSVNGGVTAFEGGFDEKRYAQGVEKLWQWIEPLRPYFWRAGRTFPAGVADLHRLFANGEVDFSMSINNNEVITKVRQGVLPSTSRAVLLRDASIANSHYVGIPINAGNPAGAMVVANFLLSPEAQLEKQRPEVWADGTVLDLNKLPAAMRIRFMSITDAAFAIPSDTLLRYQAPEVSPVYTGRLTKDWRSRIRAGRQ